METFTVTTPVGKHKVEFKRRVNGYDQETIDSVTWTKPPENEMHLSSAARANRKSFEVIVVSVDGKKEDVVTSIMEMDSKDYHYVIEQINEITNPLSDEEKKTLAGNTTDSSQPEKPKASTDGSTSPK